MQSTTLSKTTLSMGLSIAIVNMINVIIVLVKESYPNSVLVFMNQVTGHHWLTQGIITILVFIGITLIANRQPLDALSRLTLNKFISIIIGSTIISGMIMAGYFLFTVGH